MAKKNVLADKVTDIALQQLKTSWNFKLPRVRKIRNFRRLYNTEVLQRLRQQFNVPLPVFAGMVDTLQADLDDTLIVEYQNTDPADWKAVEKANAAIKQESESSRPGAQWDSKYRDYRFEKIISGRGIFTFNAAYDKKAGYQSHLEVVPFEDFFFEPMGGGDLENHLFCGRQNVWRTAGQLKKGVKNGIYDKKQVDKLLESGGKEYKMAGLWDSEHDFADRFQPLGLNPETDNYVGEEVFNLCEWVTEYNGCRWYILFEPYTGTWVRFAKNTDVLSSDHFPFISSASHKDIKNFASKGFADDLYPIADSVITLFNQDLTNRQKRNLNARAYDRQMFKDVGKLDEAQYRPDALVPVDTFNGTRRINEGIYEFKTPTISGTVDLIDWLQRDTGEKLGVTEMQQGASQPASKKVGVAYVELAQISKRLAFKSKPFQQMGRELGERFFASLKDYMKEPMSIQLLGEHGVEWDVLRRVDLSTKRTFEITVSSEMQRNDANATDKANRVKALEMTAESPHVNTRVRDEVVLREVGNFPEHEIALLLDTGETSDKETLAEVSASIQEIVTRGKKPKTNPNADRYFIKRLLEFAKKHKDTLSARRYDLLIEYADEHIELVKESVEQEATRDAREQMRTGMAPTEPGQQNAPAQPAAQPVVPANV